MEFTPLGSEILAEFCFGVQPSPSSHSAKNRYGDDRKQNYCERKQYLLHLVAPLAHSTGAILIEEMNGRGSEVARHRLGRFGPLFRSFHRTEAPRETLPATLDPYQVPAIRQRRPSHSLQRMALIGLRVRIVRVAHHRPVTTVHASSGPLEVHSMETAVMSKPVLVHPHDEPGISREVVITDDLA